jgi:hypothetical protein
MRNLNLIFLIVLSGCAPTITVKKHNEEMAELYGACEMALKKVHDSWQNGLEQCKDAYDHCEQKLKVIESLPAYHKEK